VDLLAPMTWSQASPATPPSLSAAAEWRQLGAGVGADIYQKYRIDLKYSGYSETSPPRRQQPCRGVAVRCPIAAGLAHFQDNFLTGYDMLRRTMLARASRHYSPGAGGGVR
jgi:hypothetical protein